MVLYSGWIVVWGIVVRDVRGSGGMGVLKRIWIKVLVIEMEKEDELRVKVSF